MQTFAQKYSLFLGGNILFELFFRCTCTDLGDIHARLFDHRAVLQGEINFHLKEFEASKFLHIL